MHKCAIVEILSVEASTFTPVEDGLFFNNLNVLGPTLLSRRLASAPGKLVNGHVAGLLIRMGINA